MSSNKKTFEEALTELGEIVNKMEGEDLTLDESLKYYKKGVELYQYCYSLIEKVDGEVKIILESKNGTKEENFKMED